MKVMPETAAGSHKYKGRTYYFCSRRCVERFRANPDQFLVSSQSAIRNPKSPKPSTPVRCIRKFARPDLAPVPYVAWRWNRRWSRLGKKKIQNSRI